MVMKWSICCYFTLSMHFWLFFRQTNKLGVYTPHRDVYSARHSGSVAERLKAPVLKTGDPKGFQSSNLCASARYKPQVTREPGVFVLDWPIRLTLSRPRYFPAKIRRYYSPRKYLFISHRGFDAGECHHQIISFPTFSGRTGYRCA